MREREPSRTSMMAALARGLHRQDHSPPWVLDDPFALPLIGPGWPSLYAAVEQVFSQRVQEQVVGFITARSRFAEERVASYEQYVILGAGLDSFAWRRPDLLRSLRVFEVDHPGTQAWKRQRAAELALPEGDNHVYAPVDFETQSLRDGLSAAGFDWSKPAAFSWMGVIAYLTREAVQETLRTVAAAAPRSGIALSYPVSTGDLDADGLAFYEAFEPLAVASGEPIELMSPPAEFEALVAGCGLTVEEHLSTDDIHARYFAERDDDLRPYTAERLLWASVG